MDTKKYYSNFKNKVRLNMLLVAIVIIGAINWGTTAFGFNLVKIIDDGINGLFKSDIPIQEVIYVVVAIAGILLAFRRDTWLPFLGDTIIPEALVPLKTPSVFDRQITIQTEPNVKVIYWGASGKEEGQDVFTAYGNYTNSGVVMSDASGKAELPILEGAGYVVPSGRKISRHIHYRTVDSEAIISPVKTIYF